MPTISKRPSLSRITVQIATALTVILGLDASAQALWPFDGGGASTLAVNDAPVRVYRLSGTIQEKPSEFNPFNRSGGVVLNDLREALLRDIADPKVKHLLLKVRGLAMSLAQAEELGALIAAADKAGKTVTVHLKDLDLTTLAAFGGASRIAMTPEGTVLMTGLNVEVAFYRTMMSELGLEADLEAVGEFKSAGESFTRDTMSDSARENLDAWLDDVWLQLRARIAATTKIDLKVLDGLIEAGLTDPETVRKAGLIDTLAYWSETVAAVEKRDGAVTVAWPVANNIPSITSIFDILSLLSDTATATPAARPTIAVLVAEGPIVEGRQSNNLFQDASVIAVENILDDLAEITSDPSVKAIVLRINSPGGSALASDIIWRALADAAKDRPLIVSLGSVAASGGYYIASAGQQIFADGMTLTGSIGVFGGKVVYRDLTKKIGIHMTTLGRGKNHAMMSGLSRFSDDERAAFRVQLERTYRTFVNRVARGRNMGFDAVEALARGRIWTGKEAVERGLVDAIGGLNEAITAALDKAELSKEDADIRTWPRPQGLMELLSGDSASSRIEFNLPAGLSSSGVLSVLPPTLAHQVTHAAQLLQRLLGNGNGGNGVLAYLPLEMTVR